MTRIRREPPRWPAWRYGPDGEKSIFQSEEEVPFGWTRKPGDVFIPRESPVILDRTALQEQLRAIGVNPLGTWSSAYMKELLEQ